MNRIIVSSKLLCIYLLQCSYEFDDEEDVVLKISNEKFSIKGTEPKPIGIHRLKNEKSGAFEREIPYSKLERMIKILKAVEEQPIVLVLDGTFISIREIDI